MADILELAENLRRVETALRLAESREKQLRELEQSGAWKATYDEVTFKEVCAASMKDLTERRATHAKAEISLRTEALAQAPGVPQARELVSRALATAHEKHESALSELMNRGQDVGMDQKFKDASFVVNRQPGDAEGAKALPTPATERKADIEEAIAAWERVDDRDAYPLAGPDGRPLSPAELARAEEAMLAEMERPG